MRYTDVAIIGGGLAGSTAAAMLGRAGVSAILIDPDALYPPDFRCEKIGGTQLELLRRTGLSEPALKAATHDGEVWIARFGRVVDRPPGDQYGLLYQDLVNVVRAEIPDSIGFHAAKATGIVTSPDRQRITLSDGEAISARLVVIANGLNKALRRSLEIDSRVISSCHSITVGFDVVPVGRTAFAFPALTYYAERASDRMAYLTLFPVGGTMRANLMLYRGIDDPWFALLRERPEAALRQLMPRIGTITGDFSVSGAIRIRPADLYVADNYLQDGVVLIGDAFATSCPAAGTGTDKVFRDAERLCGTYIPQWLASPGMGSNKIAAYYADPEKRSTDAWSEAKAFHLRTLSTSPSPTWLTRRWARFLYRLSQGQIRQVRGRLGARQRLPRLSGPEAGAQA